MVQDMETAVGNIERVVAVRLRPETDLLLGLEAVCKQNGIYNGVIISAIGSLNGASFCNPVELPEKKAKYGYDKEMKLSGPIELTGASGVICHDTEGQINLHIHISLSDRYGNAYGGHLVAGTPVLLTVDAIIGEIRGVIMERKLDEDLDVPLLTARQA